MNKCTVYLVQTRVKTFYFKQFEKIGLFLLDLFKLVFC